MASRDKLPNPPAGTPGLAGLAAVERERGLPPVHLWHPPFCGDIGMKIACDGTWFYRGSPIGRAALVKLFASILRKDADRYVLVTPVEMVSVEVEDAPFLAVEMQDFERGGARVLRFRTNVDDWVEVDADHPLRFDRGAHDGIKPYVKVRGDLWALVARAVGYDLIERAETRVVGAQACLGVASGGQFFVIAPAAAIEGLA